MVSGLNHVREDVVTIFPIRMCPLLLFHMLQLFLHLLTFKSWFVHLQLNTESG